MTTIPSIEGMSPDDITSLRKLAAELHEATNGLLDTPMGPRDYEEQARLRNATIIKLKEASGRIKGQITDLDAVIRDNGILMSWLRSDKERLTAKMYEGLIREKEERSGLRSA